MYLKVGISKLDYSAGQLGAIASKMIGLADTFVDSQYNLEATFAPHGAITKIIKLERAIKAVGRKTF